MLGITKPCAVKIVDEINRKLQAQGLYYFNNKVSRELFNDIYGGGIETIKLFICKCEGR